ncbi:MAG: hypothetical protein AB8H12_14145 [Lewinella sp.]
MLYDLQDFLFSIGLCLLANSCTSSTTTEPEKAVLVPSPKNQLINYWDTQRKGANFFNETPTEAWFDAAAAANIRTIRFVYDKWEGRDRDFLLGNADDYTNFRARPQVQSKGLREQW